MTEDNRPIFAVGTSDCELTAKVIHHRKIELTAYYENAEQRIQDVVVVPITMKEARELGRWLCDRAEENEPATPLARLKRAIRRGIGR
jgi:hypothetical protein